MLLACLVVVIANMALNLVLMLDDDGKEAPSFNEKGEVLLHDVQSK